MSRFRLAFALFLASVFALAASAADLWWTGAADNRWANPSNWESNQVPHSGDNLMFFDGAKSVLVNDLQPDVVLHDIKIYFGAAITGDAVQVSNIVVGGNFQTTLRAKGNIRLVDLTISGPFDVNGFSVLLSGVSVNGPITGAGTVAFSGDWNHINGESPAFAGLIRIGDGSYLTVDGTVTAPLVGQARSSYLYGTGTLGIVTGIMMLHPGYGLTCGNIELNRDQWGGTSAFAVSISGVAPGTWSKLVVKGTVTLRSTELGIQSPFAPPEGQSYVIVDNDGTEPITGTFRSGWGQDLPEGATVTAGTIPFRLSYRGGDGNDVTLTRLSQPAVTLTQSKALSVYGEPFVFTATVAGNHGIPTGSVTLSFPHVTLPLENGRADYVCANYPVAWSQSAVQASYSGDATYGPNKSNSVTHIVQPAATALTLTAAETADAVRLRAAIEQLPPSERPPSGGFVAFYLDDASVGAVALQAPGSSHIDVHPTPGTHKMAAIFLPDDNYSSSSAIELFEVRAASVTAATVGKTFAGTPAVISVTVAAAVADAAVATGAVTVSDGTKVVGTGSLVDGKAVITTVPLAAGDYAFVIEYAGDAKFRPSATTIHLRVVPIVITASDVRVTEGNDGVTMQKIDVSLSEVPTDTVTVDYHTEDGTAMRERDYAVARGRLTFDPGETRRSIALSINGNSLPEPDRQFTLSLHDPVGASLETHRITVTIADDDLPGTAIRDLAFAAAGAVELRLDLILPSAGAAASAMRLPLIVGIDAPDWDSPRQHASIILSEVSRGYAVALVTFRSPAVAAMPAQIADVRTAVRWLRANSAQFNIDPDRIGVWGIGMAGGHLAALLATADGIGALDDPSLGHSDVSANVRAVVDWYGMTDFAELTEDSICDPRIYLKVTNLLGCQPVACPERARQAGAMAWVSAGDAPLLSMHAMADCIVPPSQSRELVDALRLAHVDANLVLVPAPGHEYYEWDWTSLLPQVHEFFDAALRRADHRRRAVQH